MTGMVLDKNGMMKTKKMVFSTELDTNNNKNGTRGKKITLIGPFLHVFPFPTPIFLSQFYLHSVGIDRSDTRIQVHTSSLYLPSLTRVFKNATADSLSISCDKISTIQARTSCAMFFASPHT